MIQSDREIKARKPDIVVVKNNERSCAIIDIAILGNIRVSKKEKEKIEGYQELKREIKRMWNIKSIKVTPVVVEELGNTSKKLKNCTEELGVVTNTPLLQENSITRDSLYFNKGFRLWIRFVEKGLGEERKKKKTKDERMRK